MIYLQKRKEKEEEKKRKREMKRSGEGLASERQSGIDRERKDTAKNAHMKSDGGKICNTTVISNSPPPLPLFLFTPLFSRFVLCY